METAPIECRHEHGYLTSSHSYLLPALVRILDSLGLYEDRRVFDIGCGNGSVANGISKNGYAACGVDASAQVVSMASSCYPHLDIQEGSAYDALAERYDRFPGVVSLEVVEHLYSPRAFTQTASQLLNERGTLVISTPYHGYFKNVAIALTGKFDSHVNPLWDHGHIKFWSAQTLTSLLHEAGFQDVRFTRVGRVPQLAKSMIATARSPDLNRFYGE